MPWPIPGQRSNLRSPEAWQEAAERCPGIGQGTVYAYEQIESLRIGMTDM